MITKIILLIIDIIFLFYIYTFIKIKINKRITKELEKIKFIKKKIGKGNDKILWLGDSTALGLGASDDKYTMHGRMKEGYPNATIQVEAKIGAKIKDTLESIKEISGYDYKLIVILVGANDILKLSSMSKIDDNLKNLITEAKKRAERVIFFHGGNLAASKLLPFPINEFYSYRTRKVREIYKRIAKETDTIYIDMYTSIKDFPYIRNGEKLHARDSFHPSNEGYAVWYDLLKEAIKKGNKNHDTSKLLKKMIRDYKSYLTQ